VAGQILSLFARPKNRDWSQQELAEFYRVESALARSGLSVETDRGLTDEGEPWFVFCRTSDGEVVIHFAKCDGQYIIAGPGYERVAKGLDFSSLVRDLVSRHPLVNTKARQGSNVILHPTALLVAVVAAALLKDGEAHAKGNEPEAGGIRHREASGGETGASWFPNVGLSSSVTIDARHLAVVISAIAVTLPIIETESAVNLYHGSLSLADSGVLQQGRDSIASHTYGLNEGLTDESTRATGSHNFAQVALSPEQKLEILSFTSILLDLSTKEAKTGNSTSPELTSGNDVVQVPPNTDPTPHSELFLKIELVKGSSQLPSVQALAHHNGDEAVAVPVTFSSIQSFLDHALHLKGSANSAIDVLETLTNQGTIDQSLFASLKDDLIHAQLSSSSSPSAPDATASGSSENAVTEQQQGTAKYHLPPEGHAVDAKSISDAIKAFVRDEGHFKVLQSGDDIIFCSTGTLSASENMVRTVTWDFADGSSITLIGPPSHLPMDLMT